MTPILQILSGLILIAVTLGVHLMAVNVMLRRVDVQVEAVRVLGGVLVRTTLVLFYITFLSAVLFFEAMIWALAFVALNVAADFWSSVYFALVTLTTLGYGDLIPPQNAQLVAASCAVAGLFLMGLSTAFIVELLRRIEAGG